MSLKHWLLDYFLHSSIKAQGKKGKNNIFLKGIKLLTLEKTLSRNVWGKGEGQFLCRV